MVRSVTKKYQVWLAGYYDDFNGARAIPDDRNQPSDTTYSATKSHFGNPMNGEAFLNPRFRFSVEERLQDSANTVASTANQYLQNDGIFEWLTWDDTRLSYDDWEGRAQLQYPDGHVANRYKFDNDSAYGSDFYQRFINGHNSDASYIVPTGDNDATFGHSDMKDYDNTNYNANNAGLHSTTGTFVQRAHLTGVWMGEMLEQDHTTTTPRLIYQEIHSPSKQPFLCIQAARQADTNSAAVPSIIYDGPLNTRLDGDIFTARVALQSMITTGGWTDVGIRFEIGFPSTQAGILNDEGYTGTPAIDFTLHLDDISYDTQALLDSGGSYNTPQVTIDNAWIDVDFSLNYTTNKFKAYYNGTEITATNTTAGAYSSGYTMSGGSSTTASNLYGYQLTVTNEGSGGTLGFVSYLMIDRAGLVRYLTDDFTNTADVKILNMKMRQGVNAISTCGIQISDDPDLTGGVRGAAESDYLLNLRSLFVSSSPLDWSLLVFADTSVRIDRPIWRGAVTSFVINQKDRSRVLTLNAEDSMEFLDKQIPLWDVGQQGATNTVDTTDYWGYDAQGFRDAMYLGGAKLKLLGNDLGFDTDSSHLESSTQRTQLGSGHPIQMYNNEDTYGPNNIEDDYEAFGIVGFTEAVGATDYTIAIAHNTNHAQTTSSSLTVASDNHNASSINPQNVSGAEIRFTAANLAYSPESTKIFYIGKYPGLPSAEATNWENISSDSVLRAAWNNVWNAGPSANDYTGTGPLMTNIYFSVEPDLRVGDYFYINRRDDAGTTNLDTPYHVRHRVTRVIKMRSYLSINGGATSDGAGYFWVVKTSTPYGGSESFGDYANDTFMTNSTTPREFSWSKDTGRISGVFGPLAEQIKHRALHGRWMRDLPQSLWFQYHFGIVKHDPKNGLTGANVYCRVSASQTLSPTTTAIEVDETAYNAAPNAGVAEIWTTKNLSPATYTFAKEYKEKFMYQGKIAVSGSPNKWYLVGVKYINATYAIDASYRYSEGGTNKHVYIKFQDIDADYKHLWLLWSDMRNNGNANADGLERKSNFGLQYPVGENYSFDMYFADQFDAEGNIDKFASLKVGEDLEVWNLDATSDPHTGGPLSKPVDYANAVSTGISLSENSSGDTKLRVTKASHGLSTNDYVYIFNTNLHDGHYQIADGSNTGYFVLAVGTYNGSDSGSTGGVMYAPITGSHKETLSVYPDWENKAGALVVIDTSKFFNLNTHVNGGKTGQTAGGNTDLTAYVVEGRSGFPALIDNYWREGIASYATTGTVTAQHQNQNYLVSDVTLATNGFVKGSIGLPIDDTTNFNETGAGKMIAVYDRKNNGGNLDEKYFVWNGKLDTEYASSSGIESPITATTYEGVNVFVITNTGETHEAGGIKKGMVIERTPSGGGTTTYHNILAVGDTSGANTDTKLTIERTTTDGTTLTWTVGDTYKVVPQLAMVYVVPLSDELEAVSHDITTLEEAIWERLETQQFSWGIFGTQTNYASGSDDDAPESYEVHATVASDFMLRLMMHINGFYKSINGGTYWTSDKIRMLWNAAIMDTWLPSAKVTSIFGINNVPITSMMTTYNDTSSNDSFGSIADSRSFSLGATIKEIQESSGSGTTNSLYTTFSYMIGRDNRFELRPKYNSGLTLNRDNMRISKITADISNQTTNVRVYYAENSAFVDWPSPSLSDSTRWNIVEYPKIHSSEEALLVAKQEYNQSKNTPLSLAVEPILQSGIKHKMIESGRYGYIADPYIALSGYDDTAANVCNWTLLGTGGALFQGMVNALDGNMNVDIDPLKDRYGSSKNTNAAGDVEWAHNYYWYGSNSISNAIQIVHIPNGTPFVSDATSQPMRMWIDLKSGQSGTDIDNAEFTISVADYSFSGKARSETISGSIITKDVKHSGYYEVAFPANYGATAGAKMVFSFNAEYCRALLRHRCGDPTDSNILAVVATNTHSIFPLGKRAYTEMGGGFRNGRTLWYAPRIHVCRDLSYVPATYVSVTDAGLEFNAESMVIKNVSWSVSAGNTDNIILKLERDEALNKAGIESFLFPRHSNAHQIGSGISGSDTGIAYDEDRPIKSMPANKPSTLTDPFTQEPTDGYSEVSTDGVWTNNTSSMMNDLDSQTFGRITGRMDLPNDNLSGNAKHSILGQKRIPATPSSMRGIEGMDVDIRAISGTASLTSDGYIFAGKGLQAGDGIASSYETSIETLFIVPRDVLNNRLNIQARVTHGPFVATDTNASLYITARVEETGKSITHTANLGTGIRHRVINLLPTNALSGLDTAGNTIRITITRKAGVGDDDANTTSVILHNLDVKMERASAHTRSDSSRFSSFA